LSEEGGNNSNNKWPQGVKYLASANGITNSNVNEITI
jgi:hypothetical protein